MSEESQKKWCFQCKGDRTTTDFGKDASRWDGLNARCRSCEAEYRKTRAPQRKEWEGKNRTRLNTKMAEWRAKNPEKWQEIVVRTAYKNRERVNAKNRGKKTPEVKLLYQREYRKKNFEHILCTRLRKRAEELGLPFDLTPDDIVIPDVCPVLGVPLERDVQGQHPYRPSIDRIVPALGYVKTNICVMSFRANALKSDATVEEVALVLKFLQKHDDNQ